MKTPMKELYDWYNTESKLDGYNRDQVILDKIESMFEKEKEHILYARRDGFRTITIGSGLTHDEYYNKTYNQNK